jgi:uroporphyrinogen III methyltransferase/synthase
MKSKGICYLAGAGPGDPGLLTLKSRSALESAEVVIYDYLCNPAILGWATQSAEIIYAGKKAGAHALSQEQINALLVEKTRAGKRVVRLKGGDPFLFGRGGEEALALAEAGLQFEVIPGVSSAIAAPACAGIPITHRGMASQVTVFTGHEDPGKAGSALDYQKLATEPGTKVMLMGVERIGEIAGRLLESGASRHLPVALIRWGTTGQQRTLVGVLHDIAKRVEENGFSAPAVAVFGEVVKLRERLNWFEQRPLFGRTMVVTRTRKQAGALSHGLRELGADVFELPTIRIEPPENVLEFGQLVQDAHAYDWIIFTSPNGVDAFFEMFYKIFKDAREIGGVRIAAIGPATAQRVRDFHLAVDLQPEEAVTEGIVREFQKQGSVENERMLVVRAEITREVLAKELSSMGAIVDEAIAYRTLPEENDVSGGIARFRETGADLITFTSSSTVTNFMALNLPLESRLKMASIGPITSRTMRENGLRVDVEAAAHDTAGLVRAIQKFYAGSARQ